MENMVTRCPQCKTSFRITPAQLKTARGAVRCGSCLTIFKASENIISDTRTADKAQAPATQPPVTEEKPAAAKPRPTPAPPVETVDPDISDDELISDDMDDDQQSDDRNDDIDPSMLGSTHRPSSSLFERKPKEIKDEPLDHSDESWAVNLLEDDEEEETTQPAPTAQADPLDDEKLAALDSLDSNEYDTEEDTGLIEEREKRSGVGSFTLIADDESDHHDELPVEQDSTEPNLNEQRETPIQAFDPDRAALLNSIESDPVEMAFRVEPRTWPKKLLWAGLSLLALFALYIQWNIANFNDLARQQPYRSWYSTLCPMLSCQLPSLSAPEKISSYNLVVRSHPNIEQALIVDTIILNRAPFEQPFPKLIITFSDRDHNAIARRQFTPAEYLRGELAGRKLMPSGQPIHIALELSDPGTHAVNYSADIAP
jgi:predicted Zn finger-like uncharacterized protein